MIQSAVTTRTTSTSTSIASNASLPHRRINNPTYLIRSLLPSDISLSLSLSLSLTSPTQVQAFRHLKFTALTDVAVMAAPQQQEVDQITSGASNRIIPVLMALRASVLYVYAWFFYVMLLVVPGVGGNNRRISPARLRKIEEEDTRRRRALAEEVDMDVGGGGKVRAGTWLLHGARRHAMFCRYWLPVDREIKGILIIIHGLNEHGGRYAQFAGQLTSCNYGVYTMDWIGHGGSDGLHGYVPSLDHVVADTGAFLEKIKLENPGIPCFLFGHSTGGAVVLKASSFPHIQDMIEGIILTSPALRVKPAHPLVGAVAPFFSLVAPRFQFKGANKRGIPVTRDPVALSAKYADPLVYTGPIRVRTGHEILRLSSYLMRNIISVTVPFLVLHGTADRVTDPLASQDLYNKASSEFKDMKLYDGFLHDLLFEPEREEIGRDIIDWMEKKLETKLVGQGLVMVNNWVGLG